MITYEQALEADQFHHGECTRTFGTRGAEHLQIEHWRRNGQTLTWVRSPGRFQLPIKFGMYGYAHINNTNAEEFHVADDCPLRGEEGTF